MGAGKHQARMDTGYFGHAVGEERGMENDVMLGEMSGKRRQGRPRTRCMDNVNNTKGPSINSMRWDARDQAKWRSATAVVARGRTRLDDTRDYWGRLLFVTRFLPSENKVTR